jgi:hypothetical protein
MKTRKRGDGARLFLEGKRGRRRGDSRRRRWTTQRRVARRSGRPKVTADVKRSKMTKENWVSGPNASLGR